jgi:hypothetical protein
MYCSGVSLESVQCFEHDKGMGQYFSLASQTNRVALALERLAGGVSFGSCKILDNVKAGHDNTSGHPSAHCLTL